MPDRHGKEYATEAGRRYDRYIGSRAWAKKRLAYWRAYGRSCKVTGCEVTEGLHVHHHTYDRLEDERLSDLVGLCKEHHREVHELHEQGGRAHDQGVMSLTKATEIVTGLNLSRLSRPKEERKSVPLPEKQRAKKAREKRLAKNARATARAKAREHEKPGFGAKPGPFDSRFTQKSHLALVGQVGTFTRAEGDCMCGQNHIREGDQVVVVRRPDGRMRLQKVDCS